MNIPLKITVTDPDPLFHDAKHAVRFKTEFDETQASSNVIHLTDGELFDLLNAVLLRVEGKFRGDDNRAA